MFRSLQWRLLFNTVLVSLVTILSVGVVTLILVNTYFLRQEEEFLRLQAARLAPSILEALASGNQVELQRAVAMGGYAAQVRVQLYGENGQLFVDSGRRSGQSVFNPIGSDQPELFIGAVLDDSGEILRFSPLMSKQEDPGGNTVLSFLEPAQLLSSSSAFTSVSDASFQTPLIRETETIGFLVLSEGPAVGETITRSIWMGLLSGSVVALVVAVVVGFLSAKQVTDPLQILGTAAEAMGNNDLGARAPRSKMNEFDRLATQYNTMADRVEGVIERLAHERNLLRRTISDAGHEFRTPLTALKTFNALLEDEVGESNPGATYVYESERQIVQLEQITSAILDLSRLEARLSGTDIVEGDLREPIELAVRILQPMIDEKGLDLTLCLPATEIIYQFDRTAIQQAVSNLISNAIKFTDSGGEISVGLESDAQWVMIRVSDDGIGISPENQAFIFDRFFRYPTNASEGSGLGLSICREIVDIHHGQLTVSSWPGQGSSFTISLPKSLEATPTRA